MRGFREQLKQLGTRLRATESGMAELYGVALDAEVEQRSVSGGLFRTLADDMVMHRCWKPLRDGKVEQRRFALGRECRLGREYCWR